MGRSLIVQSEPELLANVSSSNLPMRTWKLGRLWQVNRRGGDGTATQRDQRVIPIALLRWNFVERVPPMKEALDAIDRFIQRQPEELRQTFVQPNELPRFQTETQYWGKPYDERYLLLTFPMFSFKLTDLLVLSKNATAPDDGSGDVIDFIPALQLRDGTWLTTCGLSGLGDDVYLHFYFVGKDTRIQHTSHKIALKGLPERPGPELRDGVVLARHPRISPTAISPRESATAMREGSTKLLAAPALGGGQLPYTRMFLSFDGWTFPQINCWPVDGRVESDDYLALSDRDPTYPTDHFKYGYCYITTSRKTFITTS